MSPKGRKVIVEAFRVHYIIGFSRHYIDLARKILHRSKYEFKVYYIEDDILVCIYAGDEEDFVHPAFIINKEVDASEYIFEPAKKGEIIDPIGISGYYFVE